MTDRDTERGGPVETTEPRFSSTAEGYYRYVQDQIDISDLPPSDADLDRLLSGAYDIGDQQVVSETLSAAAQAMLEKGVGFNIARNLLHHSVAWTEFEPLILDEHQADVWLSLAKALVDTQKEESAVVEAVKKAAGTESGLRESHVEILNDIFSSLQQSGNGR